MNKKLTIVTHNGKFHSDDVFGVATLCLLLGHDNVEIIRTRDPEIVAVGDYVLDEGFVYDPKHNRFDHHQKEGAGERSNGIPYAAFGLIWKHFGEQVSGSKEIAKKVDEVLVQPIDAQDSGVDIHTPLFDGVETFQVQNVMNLFRPTWNEEQDFDVRFMDAVALAQWIINRSIVHAKAEIEMATLVEKVYEKTKNKELVIIETEKKISREVVSTVLAKYPEPIYAVIYRHDVACWQLVAIRKDNQTSKNTHRKSLPASWRGKRGEDFNKAAGITDGIFCHRTGFMCVVESKESALKLAELALAA